MDAPSPKLSKHLAEVWGHVPIHYLVLATQGFLVYLDEELDIEWKTTPDWDLGNPADPKRHRSIINRVAELEAGQWDYSDPRRTRNYKRQLAEVLACSFHNDYDNAEQMLVRVENYRSDVLKLRDESIAEQLDARNDWKSHSEHWTILHYGIGTAALLFSTLSAARPSILGLNDQDFQLAAWLVAFLTGLLTFLNPEKKASRYRRAWVLLNNQISRYKSDKSYLLEPVLKAHIEGENLISETTDKISDGTARPSKRRTSITGSD
jgi:hypothetical protein